MLPGSDAADLVHLCGSVALLRSYRPHDHDALVVAQHVLIFLVVTSEEGVATLDAAETLLADLQMWLGLALMVVALGLLLVSKSCRQWLVAKLLHGRGGAPTKLQVAEREEEDEEEEDHNAAPKFSLHLRTEPAQQSVRQREALNRLVERICKTQQKKHRHDQQYQKYSANLPPPC